MARTSSLLLLLLSVCILSLVNSAIADPRKLALVQQQPLVLNYHNGALLKGNHTVNIIWYGRFTAVQRAIISDFVRSLSPRRTAAVPPPPSVTSWWSTTEKYRGGAATLSLGRQILDENYSLGKSLKRADVLRLARQGPHRDAVTMVLTASDVAVEGFCMSSCGYHDSDTTSPGRKAKFAYIWVGNSAAQCPGQCAWPFHKPIYGPQMPPLIAPNGDVGVDGMVINIATLLAGTVTNPFGNGFYQGSAEAPLEAVTACTGMFGTGAFPGYPGKTIVDSTTGASYNAKGMSGRKYLLPAMWDPKSSQCLTLV